jgi:UDP-N-acetylmuramate--alanine ligase
MFGQKQHFHFMGIGGIGMSGIATILLQRGHIVSGCDTNTDQQTIIDLRTRGAIIAHQHNSSCCADISINVLVYIQSYATAITEYHQEYRAAQARGCTILSRAQLLGQLLEGNTSICVSGSHGKTTTTAMISHILLHNNYDPTIVVGGYMPTLGNNTHVGKGSLYVVEADESDRSLLELPTTIGVVTNIDYEHLETYTDLNDIQQTYRQFLQKCNHMGAAIINADDPHSNFLHKTLTVPVVTFGTQQNADIQATNVMLKKTCSTAQVHHNTNGTRAILQLPVPGSYNIANALAAIAACSHLGVSLAESANALASFATVHQRFTYVGSCGATDIFDDYGHHPTEINHVLQVARAQSDGPVTVLFQPHRYTRTQLLWDQFIEAFTHHKIDQLIITDIYPAFESPIEGVSSALLVAAIKAANNSYPVRYIPYQYDFADLKAFLAPQLGNKGLLLLLGAGRMTLLGKYLIYKH